MIKIQNLYYMLAYAFRFLKEDGTAHVDTESFEHAADLCAALLVLGMSKQIKRGLAKDYMLHTESITSPRGRIDVAASIKERAPFKKQLVCDFDEYTENTKINQIVKTTLLLLLRSKEVSLTQKKELRRIVLYLRQVGTVHLTSVQWSSIQYQRNNVTYRMLINICEFIVKSNLLSTQEGYSKQKQVTDDQAMHVLFEKFVLGYYQKHHPSLRPASSHIEWQVDNDERDFLPRMKSDITLYKENRTLIIDTKYYKSALQHNSLYNKKTIHSSNLYQMYTYVKNKDMFQTGLVSGLLLYAKTDEEIAPNQSYIMESNRVSVKTLELNTNFSNIKDQLEKILKDF
ncbi:5-methylcytosine-specific restriction endonuclease system specificity protein McrC [Jeotgalibacillus sp. ET6]|uniref:5-methylcytosine-specific restriction endonuclease system specificity protein McrC n=1 Tax=Jeotgalibacillus sp. ET6 TaxID=3037260 RepID=UPI00241848C4|nr:5-methylcytosine-specific restriction endonuclease system specificity protein McrC [Jeotgalibacillus sp. ET6]MDG5472415.1 5-methylcytosine-specific restriction endonuclease system specificity protein McrC [Jeotgalibacillus sp. ET6]